jgi:hypothetical protein
MALTTNKTHARNIFSASILKRKQRKIDGEMQKLKLSRAEELARKSAAQSQQFLDDKVEANKERSERIADLKALRLAKEKQQKRAK